MKLRHKVKRREARKAQRHYAILGYLARFGPCPAEEIAVHLGYKLDGLIMDLTVMRTVWHTVGASREDDYLARKTQTMPAKPPARTVVQRRVYWLAAEVERDDRMCLCGCPVVEGMCSCQPNCPCGGGCGFCDGPADGSEK